MPKLYAKADGDVKSTLADIITKWHPELNEADVAVGVVMVESDGPAPAVSFAGAKAAAKIRRIPPRDRLYIKLDAMIEVDANLWSTLSEAQQIALLDHELTHLVVARDKRNEIKYDADGRPKLLSISDDWVLTGFASIAERHGANALEAMSLTSVMVQCHGQATFPWGDGRGKTLKVANG